MIKESGRRGDIAEYKIALYYLEKGWEVFTNISSKGPIDLIILHPETGEIRKIDVKSTTEWPVRKSDGSKMIHKVSQTELQEQLDVEFVYYEHSSGLMSDRDNVPDECIRKYWYDD